MKKSFFILLPVCLFIVSCSISGPAEDQWDLEEKDAKLDLGNLLGIGNTSAEVPQREGPRGRVYYSGGGYSTENLALDKQSFEDFEEFKAWRRAQESGSIDAQEYREWIEYQQYRVYKAQTEQKNTPSK